MMAEARGIDPKRTNYDILMDVVCRLHAAKPGWCVGAELMSDARIVTARVWRFDGEKMEMHARSFSITELNLSMGCVATFLNEVGAA